MKSILHINAKCSDLFSATLQTDTGSKSYCGYVPAFLPGEHYGDYVELMIDTKTGQILNWKAPTKKQLEEVFGK